LEQLVERVYFEEVLSGTRRTHAPGEMIQNLGPVKCQILKDLKSEDIRDIRPDSILRK
jgi:hypothetical protein